MKIPVIRGKIGNWCYYAGTMTFAQVSNRVDPSINELFPASCLDELLQRNLTDNYKDIKEYIENESERFFNSLILALYDGDPQWLEVEFNGEFNSVYNVGFLDLPEDVIIFPVDGQHRVAAIKNALSDNPELATEQVPVIFIAHQNDPDGRRRTRKLFSTLNRRAKPVGENAQIALDEDDVNAIIVRELINECGLFKGSRLVNHSGKQIPPADTMAFTSLVTLYQCNGILLQDHLGMSSIAFKKYQLYRPEKEKIVELTDYCNNFWNLFSTRLNVISEYLRKGQNAANDYRNATGGNILFRPVVMTEFVKAICYIRKKTGKEFAQILSDYNNVQMSLSETPWKGVLWDGTRMVTRANKTLIKYLLIYMADHNLLSATEKEKMTSLYSAAINFEGNLTELTQRLESL